MLLPRLAKVATSAVSVAAVTLAQLNLASPAFWTEQQAALYAVIVVLVGVALTEVFGSVFGYMQFSTVRRFDRKFQAVLSAGMSQVGRDATVDWLSTKVGPHASSGIAACEFNWPEGFRQLDTAPT